MPNKWRMCGATMKFISLLLLTVALAGCSHKKPEAAKFAPIECEGNSNGFNLSPDVHWVSTTGNCQVGNPKWSLWWGRPAPEEDRIFGKDRIVDPPNFDPKPSHEAEVYAELWKICAAKHLKYRVRNITDLGADAWAWNENYSWSQAISSKTDYWQTNVRSDHDTTAAAEDLIKIIPGPPTEKARNSYSNFDTGEVRPR